MKEAAKDPALVPGSTDPFPFVQRGQHQSAGNSDPHPQPQIHFASRTPSFSCRLQSLPRWKVSATCFSQIWPDAPSAPAHLELLCSQEILKTTLCYTSRVLRGHLVPPAQEGVVQVHATVLNVFSESHLLLATNNVLFTLVSGK